MPGDDLFFPSGAANLTNTNDFPAGTTFHSIAIHSGGYTLNGNTIVLGSLMKNDFAGTSTINISFQLAPSIFTAGFEQVNGTLLFAGNIDLNGRELTISPFPGSVTISGAISGSGPTISLLTGNSGDVTLSGNNTFTGQVIVGGSGRLLVSSPNGLGFADNTLANGTIVYATLAVVGVTIPNEYIREYGLLQSPVAGGAINGTVDPLGSGDRELPAAAESHVAGTGEHRDALRLPVDVKQRAARNND